MIALACLVPAADAQDHKRRPIDDCVLYGSLRFGPEIGYAGSPLAHELRPKLAEAMDACQQTVATRPEASLLARLARLRLVAGDGKGALEAATAAAEKGPATAQVLLGVMHADGVHLPRDHAVARQQFLRAAKQGDPHAQFNLGVLAANGWGAAADENEAANAFRRAATGGDPLSMQILGQRYERAGADAWLRKAAELVLLLKSARGRDTQPVRYPQGVAADPGADYQRTLSTRAAQVPVPQAAAGNAAYASPYDIVHWFPETDRAAKPR